MELRDIRTIEKTGSPVCHIRPLYSAPGMEISHVSIQPGARIPAEGAAAHDTDEYCYFISGRITSNCDGVEKIMEPGEASFIEKGHAHWCRNDLEEPCTLICVMYTR